MCMEATVQCKVLIYPTLHLNISHILSENVKINIWIVLRIGQIQEVLSIKLTSNLTQMSE